MSEYREVLETNGIKIPYFPDVISARMKRIITHGKYEATEVMMLQKLLREKDKVLELGAGVGLISSLAAQITRPGNVVTIEANPNLIPVIRETHRLNGLKGIKVLNGVGVIEKTHERISFYLRDDLWASSLTTPSSTDKTPWQEVKVEQIELNPLIKDHKPNVLVMDIEGGELDLIAGIDISAIRTILVELHLGVYKLHGVDQFFQVLHDKGFAYNPRLSRGGGSVVVFSKFK